MKPLKLALVPIVAAAMAISAPVSANSLLFQGVTFETQIIDASEGIFKLTMSDANLATDNWAGVKYLKAFEIKEIGDVTGVTSIVGPGNFVPDVDNALANNVSLTGSGCAQGGTPGACFTSSPAAWLTSSMSWTIDFAGNNLNFDLPHLKVMFLKTADQTDATGSLMSADIPAIPEPETYAMMMAGLGLMAFMVRRRRNNGHGSLVPA